LGLAHYFRRAHGLALPCSKLPAGLRDCGCHALPPALGKAPAQDGYQFRLSIDIELLGGVKDIGECALLSHGNYLSVRPYFLFTKQFIFH
jgi:hypothetical protein